MKSLFHILLLLHVGLFLSACDPKPGTTSTSHPDTLARQATPLQSAAEVDSTQKDSARSTLERLFLHVLEGNNPAAAELIAYRGEFADQNFNRPFDYTKPEEHVEVDKLCAQVKVMLHDLDTTYFKEFSTEQESEGTWNVWQVAFAYTDGSMSEAAFALIDVNGKLLLGDID